MNRIKIVNNEVVPLTPEEEAEWDLIEAAGLQKQAELARTQYQRDRAAEYPAIGDQLDALFHAGVFPAEMAATIQAVKNKYPKG
jgi:hypothetical protein